MKRKIPHFLKAYRIFFHQQVFTTIKIALQKTNYSPVAIFTLIKTTIREKSTTMGMFVKLSRSIAISRSLFLVDFGDLDCYNKHIVSINRVQYMHIGSMVIF